MARITVGGTSDDYILGPDGRPLRTASFMRWYASADGAQLTGLLLNGQSVDEIPVPAGGFFPEHQWPDGVTVAWAAAATKSDGFTNARRYKYVPPGTGGGGGGVTDYADLTGKPSLSTVATSGAYTDLTGRPALATVATTGTYGDLSGKPTIPSAPGDIGAAAASHTHSATQISNSTATGRNVLTAADKAAARTAIGLVTGTPAADEVQLLGTDGFLAKPTANPAARSVPVVETDKTQTFVELASLTPRRQPANPVGWFNFPSVLQTSVVTYSAGEKGVALFVPIDLDAGTYDAVTTWRNIAQAGGDGTMRVGLYKSRTDNGLPDTAGGPLASATVPLDATGDVIATFASAAALAGGSYWLCVLYTAATNPTTWPSVQCIVGPPAYRIPWTAHIGVNAAHALAVSGQSALPTAAIATSSFVIDGGNRTGHYGIRRSA